MGKRGKKFIIDVVRETIFAIMFVVSSVGLMSEFLGVTSAAPVEHTRYENIEFFTNSEAETEKSANAVKCVSNDEKNNDTDHIKYQGCAFFQQ